MRDRFNCFLLIDFFRGYFLSYELFSIGGAHPERTSRGGLLIRGQHYCRGMRPFDLAFQEVALMLRTRAGLSQLLDRYLGYPAVLVLPLSASMRIGSCAFQIHACSEVAPMVRGVFACPF